MSEPDPTVSNPAQVGDKNIAPTTTAAEDATKYGQRRINLIWESTQALVALGVTFVTLFVAGSMAIKGNDHGAFLLLSNVFFLVVGTYFQRTNHQRIGGVGNDDSGR
jgi:hypothetical protein